MHPFCMKFWNSLLLRVQLDVVLPHAKKSTLSLIQLLEEEEFVDKRSQAWKKCRCFCYNVEQAIRYGKRQAEVYVIHNKGKSYTVMLKSLLDLSHVPSFPVPCETVPQF